MVGSRGVLCNGLERKKGCGRSQTLAAELYLQGHPLTAKSGAARIGGSHGVLCNSLDRTKCGRSHTLAAELSLQGHGQPLTLKPESTVARMVGSRGVLCKG